MNRYLLVLGRARTKARGSFRCAHINRMYEYCQVNTKFPICLVCRQMKRIEHSSPLFEAGPEFGEFSELRPFADPD